MFVRKKLFSLKQDVWLFSAAAAAAAAAAATAAAAAAAAAHAATCAGAYSYWRSSVRVFFTSFIFSTVFPITFSQIF